MEMSDFMKNYCSKLRLGNGADPTEITKNRKQSLAQNQAEHRKIKRGTEAFTRRNIPMGMSPYISPESCRRTVKTLQTDLPQPQKKTDSRLEMLIKWKEEKEKRRQLEKAKQKPVFKVYHIATSLKVDLENINKTIKGKVIAPSKMESVPKSHQFVPPKGLKPVPGFRVTRVTDTSTLKPGLSSNIKQSATHQQRKDSQKMAGSSSTLKSGSSSTIKGSATRQRQQSSQKVSAVQTSHYNLRKPKAATKSTKSTQPITKTKAKAPSPKKSSSPKKTTLKSPKTPQNQKTVTSPSEEAKQLTCVTPRYLGSLTKPKFLAKVAEDDVDAAAPVKTPIISPFVTVSRGKKNARDEYKVKHATSEDEIKNIDPDLVAKVRRSTTLHDGPNYFMYLLNSEIERISGMCEKWETFVQDNEVPEEATSSIDVAIGQARLLIAKKFNQFRSLIVQCQTEKYEEKVITSEDLHGFWDMIYMQVEDLNKRFGNLDRLKDSNWEEMLPEKRTVKTQNKPKVKSKKPAATSRLKDMIKAARAKQRQGGNNDEIVVAGSLETQSPLKEQSERTPQRRTSRVSVIKSGTKTRSNASPSGLMMMKVTQSIKRGNGLTPTKSILKIDGAKSTGKKSVVFRESLRDNAADINGDVTKLTTPRAKRSILSNKDGKENCPVRRSERLNIVY